MPTQNKAQIDKLLTNVLEGLNPKELGFIAEEILPRIQVVQYSGKIGTYKGNEHLRIVNSKAGGKNKYREVQGMVKESNTYTIDPHGLKIILTEEDKRNYDKPFDAREEKTMVVVTNLLTEKEKSLADVLQNVAIITQNDTLSGTDQWSDLDDSDPLGDLLVARNTIRQSTGLKPDTAIMGDEVFQILSRHPQIMDQLGYKFNRKGELTMDELARVLKVKRVLVGSSMYSDSSGDLTDIWGKNFIYARTPKKATRWMKTLGFEIGLTGKSPRKVFRFNQDEPINSEKIISTDDYDQLLTDTDCAYLIEDAIA